MIYSICCNAELPKWSETNICPICRDYCAFESEEEQEERLAEEALELNNTQSKP